MSGYYVDRQGLGAVSVTDIPIIGRAIEWGDDKVRAAVETIVRKYAEFEQAAVQAPKIQEDAARIRLVLERTGTPAQVSKAYEYEQAANKLAQDAANRGPVDFVIDWVQKTKAATGMGALPVVPLVVIGAASVGVIVVASTIKSYNHAKMVRFLVEQGMSPEQIAQTAAGGSPFKSGMFGATSAITLAALGIGIAFLVKAFRSS